MSYTAWMPGYGQNPAYAPAWQAPRPDMVQGYPQQSPMVPAPSQGQIPAFAVRPVTNREEAVAAQVDFLGPGTLMPDVNHGIIYLKRFNPNTGACDFLTFRTDTTQAENSEKEQPEYATKADVQEVRSVVQGLADQIAVLRGKGKRVADEQSV